MRFSARQLMRVSVKSVIAITLLCVGYIIASPFIKGMLAHRRVLNANHDAILAASRTMINSYDQFTNEWNNVSANEKGMSFWTIDKGFTYHDDPRLPSAIRDLQPIGVRISTNYMYIHLGQPAQTYILAALDDNVAEHLAKRYSKQSVLLTDGLWYLVK